MLSINYTAMQNHLKDYLDVVADNNETILVTIKDNKNVILMSFEQYEQIMKAAHNGEYLAMIDESISQLTNGNGTQHDLIED